MRENKIRKDLEEAKTYKEEAEKKLKAYSDLIEKGKLDAKQIISESNRKLNEDIQSKKQEINEKIEKETLAAEKEIREFKSNSLDKINIISEEIVSDLVKDITGEDLNKSSIKATVAQEIKEYKIEKI